MELIWEKKEALLKPYLQIEPDNHGIITLWK